MNGTDYVVRTWALTRAGHSRATVVDRFGRIVNVTIARAHAPHGDIDGLIRDRLALLGPPKRPPS